MRGHRKSGYAFFVCIYCRIIIVYMRRDAPWRVSTIHNNMCKSVISVSSVFKHLNFELICSDLLILANINIKMS